MRDIIYFVAAMGIVACAATLGPAEIKEIGDTAATIEGCKALGRACKDAGGDACYKAYDDCMKDAGLHE